MKQQPWILEHLPEPVAGRIDERLAELLQVAAVIGARSSDDYLVSFTSIACAFMVCFEPTAVWMQSFYAMRSKQPDPVGGQILRERGVEFSQADEIFAESRSFSEPLAAKRMWTASAQGALQKAVGLAGGERAASRHLLAVYGFDPPPGHDEQLRAWKIDSDAWRASFLRYLEQEDGRLALQARMMLGDGDGATQQRAPIATEADPTQQADLFGDEDHAKHHAEDPAEDPVAAVIRLLPRRPSPELLQVLKQAVALRGRISTTSLFLALVEWGEGERGDAASRALANAVATADFGRFRKAYVASAFERPVTAGADAWLRRSEQITPGKLKRIPPDMVIAALLNQPAGKVIARIARVGIHPDDLRKAVTEAVHSAGGAVASRWPDVFLAWAAAAAENANQAGEPADTVDTGDTGRPPIPRMIARITSDSVTATATDHLDVEREAEAFARVAASRALDPPISIGVFGEWGSGKTFFMEKMHAAVQSCAASAARATEANEPTTFHSDVVQIRFNAWHYMETNLWASLVDHIFRKLDDWLQPTHEEHEVQQLYDQLATARMLKLEALESLIVARRRQRDAEQRLIEKRGELAQLASKPAAIDRSTFWRAVVDVAGQDAYREHKVKVEAAIDRLGFRDGEQSAAGLFAALEQVRDTSRRAGTTWRSLVATIGSGPGAVVLVGVVLLAPLALAGIIAVLTKQAPGGLLEAFSNAVRSPLVALSGTLAGAAGWVGKVVHGANAALATVQQFRAKLDAKLEARRAQSPDVEPDPVLEHQAVVEKWRNEVEIVERDLSRAGEQVATALQGFQQSARGRLHRFIREKIADGDYAKHLGIIATIRKDFEQLAQIMVEERRESQAAREYLLERDAYAARLDAIKVDELHAQGLLEAEEADALRTDMADSRRDPSADLRFFRRIVLYIDDLDRCPPDKVVEVLQACHLLLCFPLFVVVVAVDARWVSRALLDRFPGLLVNEDDWLERDDDGDEARRRDRAKQRDNGASPRDYLEKIFQIPYWVRRIQPDASKKMVAELASPPTQPSVSEAEQLAMASTGRDVAAEVGAGAGPQDPEAKQGDGSGAQLPATSENGSEGEAGKAPGEAVVAKAPVAKTPVEKGAAEESAAPPPKAVDANPRSLQLTSFEADELARFAPFAGSSPRSLKRFVNVYRVLRTSLPAAEGARLVNDGHSFAYRAIIGQLAIVTGASSLADRYFKALAETVAGDQGTPSLVSKSLEKDSRVRSNPEWKSLRDAVSLLAETDNGRGMLYAMQQYANLVKRYSFSARAYL